MKNVIVILGPTASGKTALSIELAKEVGGEIISADSMQIYKHMDIGTAKPTVEEMQGIPHHIVDIIEPDCQFSVAQYKELATQKIEEILNKGKVPIIAGGTGLYINSLIYNIEFSETVSDWEYREFLQQEALEKGNEYIYNMLVQNDPETANKLHVNDTKRIIRALEVQKSTGHPMSYHVKMSRQNVSPYNFTLFGLNMDRQKLYERINLRVDLMMQRGLLDEVKALVDMGYAESKIAMQALGYKEVLKYLSQEITLDEAIETIKMDTRRFAKRQLTWFRAIDNVNWLNPLEKENWEILKKIKDVLATIPNFH